MRVKISGRRALNFGRSLSRDDVLLHAPFLLMALVVLLSAALGYWPWVLSAAVVIWLGGVVYCLRSLGRRIVLLLFLFAFALLLMSRDVIFCIFGAPDPGWELVEARHLHLSLALALLGLLLGGMGWERIKCRRTASGGISVNAEVVARLERVVFMLLLGVWVFAMLSALIRGAYVVKYGYLSYYVSFAKLEGSFVWGFAGVVAVLKRVELLLPLVVAAFLALFPPRGKVLVAMSLWALYLCLSLFSGQRGPFAYGMLMIVVYWVIRRRDDSKGEWALSRRSRRLLLLIGVAIVLLFAGVEILRGVGNSSTHGRINAPVLGFLYGQGVSATVIVNAFRFSGVLPNKFFLFEFARTGIIGRLLGFEVFHGNSVDHALYGGSMTHSLSYYVMGRGYLEGRGSGSSFVAEWFHDFGYVGVFVGGVVFGVLCLEIASLFAGQFVRNALRLAILPSVLMAPRGSATAFLTFLLSPGTLLGILILLALSWAVGRKVRPMAGVEGISTGADTID